MPEVESAPEPKGLESVKLHPVPPEALMAPFGLMLGVVGLATFYLAAYIFPFLCSLAAVGLGIAAHRKKPERLTMAAIAVGAAGLLLQVVAYALNA